MKKILAAVAAATFILAAGTSFAGSNPNYNCAKSNERCVKLCDDAADTGKNARAYQKCLDRCERADRNCTERQDLANQCAAAFRPCIADAHSNADRQACREAYRECKNTN